MIKPKDCHGKYLMKQYNRVRILLRLIHTSPLILLSLSLRIRLLIVILSYGVGVIGLWFIFPRLHVPASMGLPIICVCWLFRYRGLLVSLLSTVVVIWLAYYYLGGSTLVDQTFVGRAIVGFVASIVLSLATTWLRVSVDLVQSARQQVLSAEQKRMLSLEREHQITIAYDQQRKINDLKDQFLLNVSHELRTPLTVLGSSLELLKDYDEDLDSTQKTYWLTQALTSQETLVDLVNGVLNTTMVVSEIPLPKPERVCIYQFLQEILTQLAPGDVEAYTISLHVPEQTQVWADPQLLRQVLQNLLSNAFKYVPRQTEIHIEATQETPSSPVCLSVQDAGPGIPAEELPLLFEKFVRLKRDLAGTTRGMGLGLYMCKQLVETMKGRIWVESSGKPGEGCRFYLTLPPFLPL